MGVTLLENAFLVGLFCPLNAQFYYVYYYKYFLIQYLGKLYLG